MRSVERNDQTCRQTTEIKRTLDPNRSIEDMHRQNLERSDEHNSQMPSDDARDTFGMRMGRG